ncbi:hypothetical protein, partial [Escherichia coli]|uniref:hypothetical protein n=1 Tax=Escherichia coli TaxID=562 RepID=UPI001BC8316D
MRSRFSAFYPKANYGLQGSQPSDVRAHNRAANGACDEYKQLGFAPIFPDTCYHLTHYWPAAADIPV